MVRTPLPELWWGQSLLHDRLVIRLGTPFLAYDFGSVAGPIPSADTSLKIPAVTGLIYTPIFKNPTLIGAQPGYYNSAYGITASFAPTKHFYFTYAFYDGALAKGIQTGLREDPVFDGHYFTIGEAGYAWALGAHKLIGQVAAGGWAQTGELTGGGARQTAPRAFFPLSPDRLGNDKKALATIGSSALSHFPL